MQVFQFPILLLFSIIAFNANAKTMTCTSKLSKRVMTLKEDSIEIETTILSSGEIKPFNFDLKNLPTGVNFENGILYTDNGVAGNLYDFQSCSKSEYRINQGFSGPSGIRIVEGSTVDCSCKE